ncbi:MAG: ATP-binding protein, partial [Acidobacteriota bacterium]
AVGRLAGGIAHDFNNLLTVIKGYAQLLSMQMEEGKPRSLVEEILQASERASLMTQRLLAFGRKQAVQTQNLDLNSVIAGMEKILRRLVRADIAFDVRLAPMLGRVKADPSQIEQVILNLAINASDAMPNGGTLRLETAEVDVSRGDLRGPLTAPGSFIVLSVRDTGLGMDTRTLQQVFEPFFTTKEKGKGTGLGLATVYAIVKQSGGTIDVKSEPGAGTTFRIYLPRILETAPQPADAPSVPSLPRGQETVLVVEDQPGVRALAVEFLQQQGYRVLEATHGRDGLGQFEEHADTIDLVLTDVVMPEMNGPDMVAALRRIRPEAKVLFMSGYTDEMLGPEGPSATDLLVQKPFSVEELVTKVRQIIDGTDAEVGGSGPYAQPPS